MVDVHLSIGFAPSDDDTALLTEDKMFVRIVFGNLELFTVSHLYNLKFLELQQLLAAAGQAFNLIAIAPLLHVNLMSVTFPLMCHAERSYRQVR